MTAAVFKRQARIVAFIASVLLNLMVAPAFAACTTPSGNEGDINYVSGLHVMVYCNGTSWIGMGVSQPVSFGTLTNGDFCLATSGTAISCTTQFVNLASQVTGTLPTTNGGTGLAAYTAGDVLYASATNTLSRLAIGTTGWVLTASASGPVWAATAPNSVSSFSAGTTGLTPNSATTGPIVLAGTLIVANGGTGATSLTAHAVMLGEGASAMGAVGPGATGTVLIGGGAGADPTFSTSPSLTNMTLSGVETWTFGADYSTTGSQNNVNLTAVSSVRYTGGGVATFTGIIAGASNVAGELLTLHNASSSALTISNQNASSTATNRVITGTGADLVMTANSSIVMQYDGGATRWRVIGGSAGGAANGSTGYVQFNNSGAFLGTSNLFWDNTNNRLGIGSAIPTVGLDLSQKTDALALPVGTTGQRPTCSAGTNGVLRYNSTIPAVEACVNGAWVSVGAGGGQLLGVYSSATPVTNYSVVFTGAAGSAPSLSGSTLTLASNTAYFAVEEWGGGGGGGGGAGASAYDGGGGGGGGGYSGKLITSPSGPYYYTVGSGGGAGAGGSGAAGSSGGTGATSCFGTNSTACTSPTISAAGGGGGGPGTTAVGGNSGAGGSGSSGDINLVGSAGHAGGGTSDGHAGDAGGGGSAPRGGGGGTGGAYNTCASGGAGAAYGGGGGGGTGCGTTGMNGATGGAGGITITAYSSGSTQAFNLGTQATGTLPVANGGTGDTSPLTQGSVVFAGVSGVYSQDNSNFFYDATNHRLGIGTTGPNYPLQVNGSAAVTTFYGNTTTQNANDTLYLGAGSNGNVFIDNQGNGTHAQTLIGWNTPKSATANNTFVILNNSTDRSALIEAISAGTSSGSNYVLFPTGNVGIGTTIPYYTFQADGIAAVTTTDYNNTSTGTAFFINPGSTGNNTTKISSWTNGGTVAGNLTINASGGNVGIGTTSPGDKLNVVGSTGIRFYLGDATRAYLGSMGNYPLQLAANNGTPGSSFSGIVIEPTAGNVGIGTTSPQYTLDIGPVSAAQSTTTGSLGLMRNSAGADSSPYTQARMIVYGGTGVDTTNWGYLGYGSDASMRIVYAKTGAGAPLLLGTSSAMNGTGTFTPEMALTTGGNVGIGTTSPVDALNVGDGSVGGGSFPATTIAASSGSANSALLIGQGTNNKGWVRWNYNATAASAYMDVSSQAGNNSLVLQANGGNVGIGTTAPAYQLDVWGSETIRFENLAQTTGVGTLCLDSGYPVSWIASNTCVPSDRRLKERIEPLAPALDIIGQLKPVTFYWNEASKNPDKRRRIGLIAQDVEPLIPEVVNTDGKGIKSISYDYLAAPIIKAMQELKALFDTDHNELAALKADNDNLHAANDNEAAQIKSLTARLDALEAGRH